MPRGIPKVPRKQRGKKKKQKQVTAENAQVTLAEMWAKRFLLNSYVNLHDFDGLLRLITIAYLEGKLSALREEATDWKKLLKR